MRDEWGQFGGARAPTEPHWSNFEPQVPELPGTSGSTRRLLTTRLTPSSTNTRTRPGGRVRARRVERVRRSTGSGREHRFLGRCSRLGLRRVGCPDSSRRGTSDQPDLFPSPDLPVRVGARRRPDTARSIRPLQQPHEADDRGRDCQRERELLPYWCGIGPRRLHRAGPSPPRHAPERRRRGTRRPGSDPSNRATSSLPKRMIGIESSRPNMSRRISPCAAPATAKMLSRLITTSARMIVWIASHVTSRFLDIAVSTALRAEA